MDIGKIASMELNHKQVDKATPGQSVAMKIQPGTATESSRLYGRHFDHKDVLVSHITRQSIDMLKENFRDELSKDDWRLVVELKKNSSSTRRAHVTFGGVARHERRASSVITGRSYSLRGDVVSAASLALPRETSTPKGKKKGKRSASNLRPVPHTCSSASSGRYHP